MPPNGYFGSAGGSLTSAELALLQRMARLMRPRAIYAMTLL